MFLCHKGAIPASLLDTFHINSELHTYNTRQSSNFHIPLIRTKVSQNSIFTRVQLYGMDCLPMLS